jgi:hypothetical protein
MLLSLWGGRHDHDRADHPGFEMAGDQAGELEGARAVEVPEDLAFSPGQDGPVDGRNCPTTGAEHSPTGPNRWASYSERFRRHLPAFNEPPKRGTP